MSLRSESIVSRTPVFLPAIATAVFLLALHLDVQAQTALRIDAVKDSFYAALTVPDQGHLRIPFTDFLPLSGPMPDNDADLSAEIWAGWDERYLYFYAEVHDDTVLVSKSPRPANDCLELKIDPDPSLKKWSGIMNARLSALDSADAENADGVDNLYPDPFALGALPPQASFRTNYARRRSADGYALELRLAWEWLAVDGKTVQPREGTVLGLAINVHDNDGVNRSQVLRDGSIQWSVGMADEVWLVPQLLGTMKLRENNRVQFIRTNAIDSGASPGMTYFSRGRYASQRRRSIELENWRYHPGDSLQWATPDVDDSSWEIVWPGLSPPRLPRDGWGGIGWFRVRIAIDSSLKSVPLGFGMGQFGASEVYLDGKLLYTFGKVGHSAPEEERVFVREPRYLLFPEAGLHTLAVRYSNHKADRLFAVQGQSAGFWVFLDRDYEQMVADHTDGVRVITMFLGLFVLLPALLMLFHVFLFAFYPQGKENLFFALSISFWLLLTFNDLSMSIFSSVDLRILFDRLVGCFIAGALLFGLLTFYTTFLARVPRHFTYFVAAAVSIAVWASFDPTNRTAGYTMYACIGISTLEMVRVVLIAGSEARRRRWVIGVGFGILMLAVMYQILMGMGILPAPFQPPVVYMWGFLVLIVAVSVDLSRTFARTNRELSSQLVQVREYSQKALEQERHAHEEEVARQLVEADNARKTMELEEARRIQLSMLPRELPVVSGLDIAVYTQPASEVGGDYYDFRQSKNGTLTIAVGDATGHGMKAGTMVATVKGMFSAQTDGFEALPFFQHCSATIREMHLGNLYMGMTLANIRAGTLKVSAAGMPPVLVYRGRTGDVEAMTCRGMPLGAVASFPYEEKETRLEPGDTVLLMSDGLAELFNADEETYDYPRINETFARIASCTAQEMIAQLVKEGDAWRGKRAQNDDVTFVVVKKGS